MYLHSKEALLMKLSNTTNTKIDDSTSKIVWMAYLWGHHDAMKITQMNSEQLANKDIDELRKNS